MGSVRVWVQLSRIPHGAVIILEIRNQMFVFDGGCCLQRFVPSEILISARRAGSSRTCEDGPVVAGASAGAQKLSPLPGGRDLRRRPPKNGGERLASAGHVGIEIQIDDRVFLRALRTQGQPIGTNLKPLVVPHYTHVLDR